MSSKVQMFLLGGQNQSKVLKVETVEFCGGELTGVGYRDPASVKEYARCAQLGEILQLDHPLLKSNGSVHRDPNTCYARLTPICWTHFA